MATCEKCGRALDDEYAKEWHWCPECREKAGSTPYGSCEICGKTLNEKEKGGICGSCLQNAEELYESEHAPQDSEAAPTPHSGKGCAVTIAVGLLAIVIFAFLSAVLAGGESEDSVSTATSSATSSTSLNVNPQKSAYEIERDADFDEARSYSKEAIEKVAAHPESVNITDHNKNKFRGGGVFFHDYGKVSFRDSSGADREEEYEHTYVTNGTQFVSFYLKIGADIIYDYRENIDSETGMIISPNFSVGGRSYGQPVVEGRISSSKDWSRRPSQASDGKIPAEKYSQVKYDVEVEFIMNVQELVSTVTGKMDFDYQSFQFVDAGDNVIVVSIDFTSKNVLGVDLKYTAKAAYDYNPADNSATLMFLGVDDQVYYLADID